MFYPNPHQSINIYSTQLSQKFQLVLMQYSFLYIISQELDLFTHFKFAFKLNLKT